MAAIQIAALVYLILYYGLLVLFRSYLLYKRTGIHPVRNMEKKGLHGFIERVFGVCFVLVSVIILNFVFIEDHYQWFIPIPYLEQIWIGQLGMILGFAGLTIGFIAQLQMGDSWRLGLNQKEQPPLITKGLYQYSRNPVYLGILISYIGFFLMMPNALSFCFLVVSYVAMEIKIDLEEQYLETKHLQSFRSYKRQVRRWI